MKYNPALDGLRALAVTMVVAYHAGAWWAPTGYLGVDVFFVLSGYLISTILLHEQAAGGIRLGAFYLRRARRLYPALCLLLAGVVLAGMTLWQTIWPTLLYLGDYLGTPGALAHTWSLAVEEHYYLLWPLLLPFVARMERRKAIAALAAAYVAASLWSAYNGIPYRDTYRFDTRMSGLIFGSLLAFAPALPIPLLALAASVMLLAFGVPTDRMFTEAATAATIILSTRTVLPWLTRSAFTYVGRISYGLYLYHWPIAFLIAERWDGTIRTVVTMLAAGSLAAVSYHTVERYFRTARVSDPGMQPSAA